MLNILDSLLGTPQQRQASQDFVNRYEQGPPHEGYSDQEVRDRYQNVAAQLPPDLFHQSATQALERLSPQQRMELGHHLQQQAQNQNIPIPGMGNQGATQQYSDPGALAQILTGLNQQQPGLLGQLLGGGGGTGGNMFDSPVAKAAMAGIAAIALKRLMSQQRQ